MASLEEIRQGRLEKIEILKNAGMEPYLARVPRDMSLGQVRERFADLEKSGDTISLTGRVVAIRGSGAINFVVLQDGSDQFQTVIKKDDIKSEEKMQLFQDAVDVGDFISVTGIAFTTKRGEPSLLVHDWIMATKSLLPLPEKFHGIQDIDEIYRKRYLQTISDTDAYQRFVTRSQVVQAIRSFMYAKDFMEVETPVLQNQAGGAMAETFDTHHNDYDIDMVLRISLEIEHKTIMAGGYPRIFEIAKNFRNEGSDPTHIQEFTMIEWYAAYATLEDNMDWTQDMIQSIARDVVGSTTCTVYDKDGNAVEVNLDGDWPRVRFGDLLMENAGIDMVQATDDDIATKAAEYGMGTDDIEKTSRANLLDFIYKKSSRNNIVNPTFVMNYPGDMKPLAQQNDDGTAQVAQLIIGGAEITNQYAELVDPIRQRELLKTQSAARAAGDNEAMEINDEFLTAMEHGMPPMTGFGMGIDRLVAILTSQRNLRDVIFFPIMKPRKID